MNYKIHFDGKKACVLFIAIALLVSCGKDPGIDDKVFIDARDNHSYEIVAIGAQTWLAENLAYLPSVFPSDQGSQTDPFCYVYGYEGTDVKSAAGSLNFESYGVLYNWSQAQAICPTGWHLPSEAEWNTLSLAFGGDSLAGVKLRSKNGWNGKGNGDNASGLNAIPGGYRNKAGGFFLLGENAGFWTTAEADSAGMAIVRDLGYDYPDFGRSSYDKRGGFSVRCIKN